MIDLTIAEPFFGSVLCFVHAIKGTPSSSKKKKSILVLYLGTLNPSQSNKTATSASCICMQSVESTGKQFAFIRRGWPSACAAYDARRALLIGPRSAGGGGGTGGRESERRFTIHENTQLKKGSKTQMGA